MLAIFDPLGENGIGDDTAVIDLGNQYLLATSDMIQKRTHIPDGTKGSLAGWYSAAINLSDIAAMGGSPLGLIMAIGAPRDMPVKELEDITRGIRECAETHGARVLGGDTKEAPELTITGTALGLVGKRDIMRRRGAGPGDIVALTGQLGNQLAWYKSEDERDIAALMKITPRIKEGQALAQSGAATSCIDLSDGLSTSLHHLRKANAGESDIGFEIDFEAVPFIPGISGDDAVRCLHLGGEFELLVTLRPDMAGQLLNSGVAGTPLTAIGKVIDEEGVYLSVEGASQTLEDGGYEHFKD